MSAVANGPDELTDARPSLAWRGTNRREAIRFLGDAWRGFSGQWAGPGKPDPRTVEMRTPDGIVSVHVGQIVTRQATGELVILDGATA